MAEPSPEMTPQVANVHKATLDNITFSKKQQWAITNYTVLIYAGLFGLGKSLGPIGSCERAIFVILAALTFVCSALLIIQIQRDTGRYRVRLQKIHDHWLTEEEKRIMDIEPYANPVLRGVWFLVALIVVSAMGAGIVIYSLLR